MKNGDIISVDIGACYKGYHGDSAMTHGVGEISEDRKNLLRITDIITELLEYGSERISFLKASSSLSNM